MKVLLSIVFLVFSSSAFAQGVPAIPFEASTPLKLPKDLYFGEVTGVAVNAKGHVFVLSRGNTTGPAYAAAAAQLLEFDAKGDPEGRVEMVLGRKQEASDEDTAPLKHPNPSQSCSTGECRS